MAVISTIRVVEMEEECLKLMVRYPVEVVCRLAVFFLFDDGRSRLRGRSGHYSDDVKNHRISLDALERHYLPRFTGKTLFSS